MELYMTGTASIAPFQHCEIILPRPIITSVTFFRRKLLLIIDLNKETDFFTTEANFLHTFIYSAQRKGLLFVAEYD